MPRGRVPSPSQALRSPSDDRQESRRLADALLREACFRISFSDAVAALGPEQRQALGELVRVARERREKKGHEEEAEGALD